MKRTLIATILGIAATAATYGQGFVNFNTYAVNSYAGSYVTYGPGSGGAVGENVVGGFNVQLGYYLGTVSDPASNGSLLGQMQLNTAVIGGLGTGGFPGRIQAGNYTIPNYVSGPITFEMLAFNGASYALSDIRGHSAAWTMASIATGVTTPGTPDGMPAGFTVSAVPEPTTMALAGLGAAAMLIFRRRDRKSVV